jgi:hypothetical protein
MAKMKELALRTIEGTVGGGSRGTTVSHIGPINKGGSVNVRLSDKVAEEMRARKIAFVRYRWDVDDERVHWLRVRASESGLKVRYDNKSLKPHIHIPTDDVGKATYVPGGSFDCPEEKIEGDEFWFRIPDGLRFDRDLAKAQS